MEFSIIVPVYNREKLVLRTLDSILAQQFEGEINLILIDNNSTDNTLSALNKFASENKLPKLKISLSSEDKADASEARNRRLQLSSSEWIIFIDSDDTMEPSLLQDYANALKQYPNADLICCRGDRITLDGKNKEQPFVSKNSLSNHILHTVLLTNRYCINKIFLSKAGNWDENLPGWNDWEFGIRIMLNNPNIIFLKDKILVHNYLQAESITGTDFSSKLNIWLNSIDASEKDIINSDIDNKEYYLQLLNYRST